MNTVTISSFAGAVKPHDQVHAESEILTDHTDMICSTSIERIVTGRNAALSQIEAITQQIKDVSALIQNIGGGETVYDWAMKSDVHRWGCWLLETSAGSMQDITRNLDRNIWRDLMYKSGMLSLMDAQAREEWHKNLKGDNIPAINEANILSTFEQLHQDKHDVFERGIINLFGKLSWNFKTNSPCKIGRKIIMTGLVTCITSTYTTIPQFMLDYGPRSDQLADLERMLMILDGKPVPDCRCDIVRRLASHIDNNDESNFYEDNMFSIRYFQKGTAHITFKRSDLIDKLNDIIARHYPGMLAAR